MFRRFLLSGSTLAIGLMVCAPTYAQDHYLNQLYGQGVHAFHSGNSGEAERLLDDAINAGSKDPRAYYFRAFAKMRSGNQGGAESDIQMGAGYELDGYNGYDIGLSLQRVQGPQRVTFEGMRRQATLALQQAKRNAQQGMSGHFHGQLPGTEILRSDVPPRPLDVPAAPSDPTDPFGDGADSGAEALPDPFADDPAETPAADPSVDGLFGDDATTEELPPSAEAEDDSLFGDDTAPVEDASADADLFGDEAAADTPADAAPADAAADDEGMDDLFGPDTDAAGDADADDFFN